jgi:hypothetical protein
MSYIKIMRKMKVFMKLFDKMKEIESKAAPIEKWTGSMNYPFYGHLDQPQPSLSKHEDTKRGEGMLHCDDLVFILTARRVVPKLLEALDIAMECLNEISGKYGTTTQKGFEYKIDENSAKESLKKIETLNEES